MRIISLKFFSVFRFVFATKFIDNRFATQSVSQEGGQGAGGQRGQSVSQPRDKLTCQEVELSLEYLGYPA